MDELVAAFGFDRVGKSGAKFDPEKAKWYNQQYLRMRSDEDLAKELTPLLEEAGLKGDSETILKSVALLKERAFFVKDMTEGRFMFEAPTSYEEKIVKKKWKEETPSIMKDFREAFAGVEPFEAENIELEFKALLERKELGMGAVMPNLRILVTGQGMGPSFFHTAEILGKEETLKRMDVGIEKLS